VHKSRFILGHFAADVYIGWEIFVKSRLLSFPGSRAASSLFAAFILLALLLDSSASAQPSAPATFLATPVPTVQAAAPYYDAVAAADTAAGLSPMSAIVPANAPSARNDPVSSDEFVGPFSSWTNVKIAYGAVGDGVSDDTAAIQNALNAVGTSGHSPVLYFPAGTYKITATLNLAHAIDISLIGQDPSVTSIVWNGAARGTMLYVNGVAYSKFSRLTFNGSSTALIAVDQSKADGTSNYFDTGNEYSDDYFTNVGYGIRGGAFGYGFAETSVERSHFIGNSVAGIALMNFNALDL